MPAGPGESQPDAGARKVGGEERVEGDGQARVHQEIVSAAVLPPLEQEIRGLTPRARPLAGASMMLLPVLPCYWRDAAIGRFTGYVAAAGNIR